MKVREIKAKSPQQQTVAETTDQLWQHLTPEQEEKRKSAKKIAIAIALVLGLIQVYFLFPQEGFGSLLIIGVPTWFFGAFLYIFLLVFFDIPLPDVSQRLSSSYEFKREDPYFDPGNPISTLNPANPNNPINQSWHSSW